MQQILKKARKAVRSLVVKVLPESISNQLIRHQLKLDLVYEKTDLSCEVITDIGTLRESLELVQNSYRRMGYSNNDSVRLTPYHLLPRTLVACVKREGKVIGSMTIIPDSEFGLPIESCVSTDSVKVPGHTVELSSLAVDSMSAGQRGEVLFNLIKFMYHCNVDLLDAQMEVIGVNPSMVPLYRSVMLFDRIPGSQVLDYEFVGGAPVVPMYFDLRSAVETYGDVYRGKPLSKNMLDFFLAEPPKQFLFPRKQELQSLQPQNNADSLAEIISWKPGIIASLSEPEFESLLKAQSGNLECQLVLKNERSRKQWL